MAKLRPLSKTFLTLALIVFMLSLASMVSPLLQPVQAQGATQSIVSLDGCASDSFSPTPELQSLDSGQYIGNSNSGIFHYAWCRYVGKMSANHKVYFESRDDAINSGYRPCKVCQP